MNKEIILKFEAGMELAQMHGGDYFDLLVQRVLKKKKLGVRKLAYYRGYIFERGIF